jgi:hypothetical protein
VSDETPDLTQLAGQQRQILTELGNMRDDMAVLTAIALRQDSTLTALLVSCPRSPSHLAAHAGDQQATENKELVSRILRFATMADFRFGTLGEIRAMHSQNSRLANRVRDLEAQP